MKILKYIKRIFGIKMSTIVIFLGILLGVFVNIKIAIMQGMDEQLEAIIFGIIFFVWEVMSIYLATLIIEGIIYFIKFISAAYFLYKLEDQIDEMKIDDIHEKESAIREVLSNTPTWKRKVISHSDYLSKEFKTFAKSIDRT